MDIFKRLFALIGENGQGIGTSSFGHWVKHVTALNLSSDERFAVDGLIDECYAHLDEGKYFFSSKETKKRIIMAIQIFVLIFITSCGCIQ